ncbi:hypothetical protein F511_47118 [Dorcoceras hygrometricum]|uniref:Uncharacterized protein n=1 Tax=Dorcoceras hygrometricum TaxID=472368 RepID=A0A2Z6ZRS2_9LAMI|nr:hypothetical protein F511_47118 [Dorcoceras hygrometricum]
MARWLVAAHRCCIGCRALLVAGRCDTAELLSCDDRLMCAAAGRALVARGGRTTLLEWATLGAAWSTPFVVATPPAGRRSGDVVTADFF